VWAYAHELVIVDGSAALRSSLREIVSPCRCKVKLGLVQGRAVLGAISEHLISGTSASLQGCRFHCLHIYMYSTKRMMMRGAKGKSRQLVFVMISIVTFYTMLSIHSTDTGGSRAPWISRRKGFQTRACSCIRSGSLLSKSGAFSIAR